MESRDRMHSPGKIWYCRGLGAWLMGKTRLGGLGFGGNVAAHGLAF